jgi:glycosyltransferase involved in cell wall biosynthesis
VTLAVCGSTYPVYEWYERQLRNQVRERELAGAVTFHGYVAPTRPLLEAADLVLVPSFRERFGNAAVEGMLAGRPVVATNVQGLAAVIDRGRSGLLVEAGSAADLADAIAALDDDPALAARLGATGRREATARFAVGDYRQHIARLVSWPTPTPSSPPSPQRPPRP